MPGSKNTSSLVTIVVTCYNHGRYLANAIESIRSQTYHPFEIILVDDGSNDDTSLIAISYPDVKYIFQVNKGLASARNTGVANSKGQFIVFLDADDILLPDAISLNVRYLLNDSDIAFVSGGHVKIDMSSGNRKEEKYVLTEDHYLHLLHGNYIGMHAAVMYRRSVFDKWLYDTSLQVCEDYDLYIRIARESKIIHHPELIAEYRLYDNSLSSDLPKMLRAVLAVLAIQKDSVKNLKEKLALRRGARIWKDYYANKMITSLCSDATLSADHKAKLISTLREFQPIGYFKYIIIKLFSY